MKLNSLQDLFILEIQDLYDAEQQITQAMPTLLPMIHSQKLKDDMTNHLSETEEQIKKLEEICSTLQIEPVGKQCVGMEGIIEEGIELIQENNEPSPVLDAAIIGALQKIEHYEISGYGTAAAYAKQLGYDSALTTLVDIMNQEKKEDETLSKLAEGLINIQAEASQNGKFAM